ncbi:membrane protein [Bacteroidia bacterium]|nr:membrane protein [Bacteroidia bacterium]
MKTFIKEIYIKMRVLSICISGMLLYSCNDFLDVDDYFKNTQQFDSIFTRRDKVEQYLKEAASYLPNEGNLWTNSPGTFDIVVLPFQGASDENFLSFTDARHASNLFLLDELTPTTTIGGLQPYENYSKCYIGIRKASIILQRINEVQDISDIDRRDFMGRCYFMRGYYYYLLLSQYGPVPVLPEKAFAVDATADVLSVERSTYDECVEQICKDLEQAVTFLPSRTTRSSSDIGIPVREAAMAAISRVRLYAASPWFNGGSGGLYSDWTRKSDGAHFISQTKENEKWGKAAVAARRVMNTGLYELHTAKKKPDTQALPVAVTTAYATRPVSQFDPSEIDTYRSFAEVFNGDVLLRLNDEIIYSSGDIWTGGNSPAGIAMSSAMGGMNGLNLTHDVASAFYMADGTPFTMQADAADEIGADKTFSGYLLRSVAAKMYDNREMRFYVTMGFQYCFWPGTSSTNNNVKNVTIDYSIGGNAGANPLYPVDYNHTGYTCKKYVHPEDMINNGSIKAKSFPIFRYAETLLNYAEALNELDGNYSENDIAVTGRDENEILNAFNQIRYRAGLPGLTALPSREEMRDLIKKERRVEFACEGRRYHDLRRWGDAYDAYNRPVTGMNIRALNTDRMGFHTLTTINDDKGRRFFDYKNYFWPIPKTALNNNSNLVQNPGW